MITFTSTRLDAAETQPGFLDVKMRTEVLTPPGDLVAVLGAEAELNCQVRLHQIHTFTMIRQYGHSVISFLLSFVIHHLVFGILFRKNIMLSLGTEMIE